MLQSCKCQVRGSLGSRSLLGSESGLARNLALTSTDEGFDVTLTIACVVEPDVYRISFYSAAGKHSTFREQQAEGGGDQIAGSVLWRSVAKPGRR